jgi:hypothetical protein
MCAQPRRATFFFTAVAVLAWTASASASAIYGTLSNFDIYNTTPEPSEGAEIELEGCDSTSIGGHYPSHYSSISVNNYNENGKSGVRIRFEGYNFNLPVTMGSLPPNPNPVSTNGHQLVNSAGGEHFGFWLNGAQPTETRFYWLNNNGGVYDRIGTLPEIVPGPTWAYVPPAPGAPPVVQAVVKVPEPAEVGNFRPDSTWMKIYKVKLPPSQAPNDPVEMQALLLRLISDANPENEVPDEPFDDIVPHGEDPIEVETEWELMEGGKAPKEKVREDEIGDSDKVVIRRYEFYEYIGEVNEDNEPISVWEDIGNPLDPGLDVFDDLGNLVFAAERGDFISSNMVAAVLNPIPEPAMLLLAAGFGLLPIVRRRAQR